MLGFGDSYNLCIFAAAFHNRELEQPGGNASGCSVCWQDVANSSHEEAAASHRQGTQTEGCCQNTSTPPSTSLEVTQVYVGMSENRTKGTLDPCVVSRILNSECTELPANGGLCLCPSSHGGPAKPVVLLFSCSPSPRSHKKAGTKVRLSNEASLPCSMGTNFLCHSQGNMNFLQPSPVPQLCWGMLADPQGQAEAATQGWSFPGLSSQLREVCS